MAIFKLHDIEVEVVRKRIKHLYLRVDPTSGLVKISAPVAMSLETIRRFLISKLQWIKNQQIKLHTPAQSVPKQYIDDEGHYFNGKRYSLKLVERETPPKVSVSDSQILLHVRPGTKEAQKRAVLDNWYRQQLEEKASALIAFWEKKMNVSVAKFTIRKMKTRWGSCTPRTSTIRINLDLAMRPPECLEYLVVHELVHLLEPSHNHRFKQLMDQFLPKWRVYRKELNTFQV